MNLHQLVDEKECVGLWIVSAFPLTVKAATIQVTLWSAWVIPQGRYVIIRNMGSSIFCYPYE